jgi:hypothetical protein
MLIGLPCAVFVAVAVRAAATLPPNVARHPQPALYFSVVGVAFVLYCAGLLLVRARASSLVAVLVVALLIQCGPLLGPLLLSQDATAYWDYGRIAAIHDGNPYVEPPSSFRGDPAFPTVAGAWRGTTSAYGPLFTIASEAQALVAGTSVTVATQLFRVAAAIGVLTLTILVMLVSSHRAFAAVAVGWNPLVAVHFAGGGHNDVWMMVPLLGALAFDARGRKQAAGALWAVAAAIKWIPLTLLPLRIRPRTFGRQFGAVGFLSSAVIITAVATSFYGGAWLRAALPIAHDFNSGTKTSIAHLLRALGVPHLAATVVVLGSCALAYAWLLTRKRITNVRLGLGAGLLLVATPWLLPWYLLWSLPLAAAEDDAIALGLSVLLSGYMLEARAPL